MICKVNILYGKLDVRKQPTFVKVKVGKLKYTTESGTDPEKPKYNTELKIELTSEDSKIEFHLREPSIFTRWGGGKLGNSRKVSLKELCLSDSVEKEIKIYKKQQIIGSIFVEIFKCTDDGFDGGKVTKPDEDTISISSVESEDFNDNENNVLNKVNLLEISPTKRINAEVADQPSGVTTKKNKAGEASKQNNSEEALPIPEGTDARASFKVDEAKITLDEETDTKSQSYEKCEAKEPSLQNISEEALSIPERTDIEAPSKAALIKISPAEETAAEETKREHKIREVFLQTISEEALPDKKSDTKMRSFNKIVAGELLLQRSSEEELPIPKITEELKLAPEISQIPKIPPAEETNDKRQLFGKTLEEVKVEMLVQESTDEPLSTIESCEVLKRVPQITGASEIKKNAATELDLEEKLSEKTAIEGEAGVSYVEEITEASSLTPKSTEAPSTVLKFIEGIQINESLAEEGGVKVQPSQETDEKAGNEMPRVPHELEQQLPEPPVPEPSVPEPPEPELPQSELPMPEPPVSDPPMLEPPAPEPAVRELSVIEPHVPEPQVPETSVPEPLVLEPPVPEPPVSEPHVQEPPVPEPHVPEPQVPETLIPETSEPEQLVPESNVPEQPMPQPPAPEPAVPEPPIPEPNLPEPQVPETSVPEPLVQGPPVPEPPVQDPPLPEPRVPGPQVPETSVPETSVQEPSAPEPHAPKPQKPEPSVKESPVLETPAPKLPLSEPPLLEPPVPEENWLN